MATIILFAPLIGALICGFGWRLIGERPGRSSPPALLFLAGLPVLDRLPDLRRRDAAASS